MREALPEDLQSTLFDWTAPTPEEAVGQVIHRHGLHCRMHDHNITIDHRGGWKDSSTDEKQIAE
jgi:hypothetical protein